jgi:hypothetical protein
MSLRNKLDKADFWSVDSLAEFGFPGFRNGREDEAYSVAGDTMAYRRLRKLGLEYQDIINTLSVYYKDYKSVKEYAWLPDEKKVVFTGVKVSDLNSKVTDGAHIVVAGERILFDEPLFIEKSVYVDFGYCRAYFDPSFGASHAVIIRDARNVILMNLELTCIPCSGIIVLRSKNVQVTGCRFTGINGCPLTVLGNSERILISGNTMEGFSFAGIHVQGRVTGSVIESNDVSRGTGIYNGHPGIFICDRARNLPKKDDFSGREVSSLYRYAVEKISERLSGPTGNVIVSNRVAENKGSGIYSDGAMFNYYAYNRLEQNGKEGACFDFGSTGNMFIDNTVVGNGSRNGHTDRDLESDYVLEYGRMIDGTAKAKVPGVSLDNALYNVLLGNIVQGNYGGGIKCVRSGFYNVICNNLIKDNNRGENDIFHFFGIELGAAPAENDWDESDICPSVGNIVIKNSIKGNHYAGIGVPV